MGSIGASRVLATCVVSLMAVACGDSREPTVAGAGEPLTGAPLEPAAMGFVPNRGQIDGPARFFWTGSRSSVYVAPSGITIAMTSAPAVGHVLRLEPIGARPDVTLRADDRLPGRVSHFVGDPDRWRRDLPRWGSVVYEEPWPGIDLRIRGTREGLKYELVVAPGADSELVRMRYRGADAVTLAPGGALAVETSVGVLEDAAPIAYQEVGGVRRDVPAAFDLAADGTFGFDVGAHDPTVPLVIDPGLVFATYLGGSSTDTPADVVVDEDGDVYLAGDTATPLEFPWSTGPVAPRRTAEVFVTRLDSTLSSVVYSTLLGGSADEHARGMALGPRGRVVVAGETDSDNFPFFHPVLPIDDELEGPTDGFVVEVDENGDLIYGTYVGASGHEAIHDVAVDGDGHIYLVGRTDSPDFLVTAGAFGEVGDYFVAKIHRFRAFFDFSGRTDAPMERVAVIPGTAGGGLMVAGDARSNDGDLYVDVRRLDDEGTAFDWSTRLDGSGDESLRDLAVGPDGSAYVTGQAFSLDFPTTPDAFDRDKTTGGPEEIEAYVARIAPDGSLVYSTLLGDTGACEGDGVAVGADGSAYITGLTVDGGVHIVDGSLFTEHAGGRLDAFVTRVSPDGASLIHSTYLGGSDVDFGTAIAINGSGHAIVAGLTYSDDFPVTEGAFDTTHGGGDAEDVFVARFPVRHIPRFVRVAPEEDIARVGMDARVEIEVRDHRDRPAPDLPMLLSLEGGANDAQAIAGCETGTGGSSP